MINRRRIPYDELPVPTEGERSSIRLRVGVGILACCFPLVLAAYYWVAYLFTLPLMAYPVPPRTVFRTEANLRISLVLDSLACLLSVWCAWRLLRRQSGRGEWIALAAACALVGAAITFFS